MKPILTAFAVLSVFALCSFVPAGAQLLTYTFPGAGANSGPQYPTVTANGDATGTYGLGAALGADSNGYVSGFQVHSDVSGDSYPATLDDSESAGAYYSFTITPNAGDMLNLSTLDLSPTTFFYQRNSAASSYTVEESTDGFSTAGNILKTYQPASDSDFTVQGTPLTLTGLHQVTGPVEFRIYLYGQTGNYFIASLQNSLSIDGSVEPIPEPSSCALLLAGGLILLALGRRCVKRA